MREESKVGVSSHKSYCVLCVSNYFNGLRKFVLLVGFGFVLVLIVHVCSSVYCLSVS